MMKAFLSYQAEHDGSFILLNWWQDGKGGAQIQMGSRDIHNPLRGEQEFN
jgi:hypothetical protein